MSCGEDVRPVRAALRRDIEMSSRKDGGHDWVQNIATALSQASGGNELQRSPNADLNNCFPEAP